MNATVLRLGQQTCRVGSQSRTVTLAMGYKLVEKSVTYLFGYGLAAFGGCTLHDILLDRRPFFWVQHAVWLWALLVLCAIAMLTLRARHFELTERAVLWPDALGLGLFSASGAKIALDMQMPAIVAVLMGVITAVFGGVLRDIVCNEIPSAFRDHRPYAVCAFMGTWVLVLAHSMNAPDWLGLAAAAGTTVLLRGLALWTGYQLPAWDPVSSSRD